MTKLQVRQLELALFVGATSWLVFDRWEWKGFFILLGILAIESIIAVALTEHE